MHAAEVRSWGNPPCYVEIPDLEPPPSGSTQVQVKVLAVGLHPIVRQRAAGQHYSSTKLPHIPGTDGVGTIVNRYGVQQTVYFNGASIGKSFQEFVNVPQVDVVPLPDNMSAVQAAGLVNPALSSWMAVTRRCNNLPPNFTALIMGVSSASGRVAISLLRALGAGRILGCARDEAVLQTLTIDRPIVLKEPTEETDWGDLKQVDLVLDYLNGLPALHLLKSLPPGRRVQYVQIGSLAGPEFTLPASLLRSKDVLLVGSGIGSWGLKDMREEMGNLVRALKTVEDQELQIHHLREVEQRWDQKGKRTVFVTDYYSQYGRDV